MLGLGVGFPGVEIVDAGMVNGSGVGAVEGTVGVEVTDDDEVADEAGEDRGHAGYLLYQQGRPKFILLIPELTSGYEAVGSSTPNTTTGLKPYSSARA